MREYFSGLLGNEDIKKRIGASIESGRMPHALLLGGPSGSGKKTLAMEISAALSCEHHGDSSYPLPCRSCNTCRRIFEGSYTDIKVLQKNKDKATIGVDAIKDFREDMFLSATESEHKVYIIDNAECMTAEAQNALLKVLEEPPRRVTIILLATECDRILTTIKSRVQYLPLARFNEDELARHLISRSRDAAALRAESEEKFRGIIMSADGRLGRAMELTNKRLAEENEEERREVLRFISAIGQRAAYSDVYAATSTLPQKRTELISSLERIISALRDLIAVKECKEIMPIFFTSREEAASVAKDFTIKRLLTVYDAVNEAHGYCTRNANVSNLIANLASRLMTK